MRTQFTVTLSPDLADYVEEQARSLNTTKSAVVERALTNQRDLETEALMREGYEEEARRISRI